MRMLKELMDQWPFLINDMLLCQNPNDVWEWEKQVALWADNDDKVWFASLIQVCCSTIQTEGGIKAIKIIIPRKATLNNHNIFVNFAKFYEQGGVMSTVAPDLNSAQQAFEQGTKMPFRMTDKLVEVWCEWAEMKICNK